MPNAGDHADGDEQCVDGAEQRGAEEADAPEREQGAAQQDRHDAAEVHDDLRDVERLGLTVVDPDLVGHGSSMGARGRRVAHRRVSVFWWIDELPAGSQLAAGSVDFGTACAARWRLRPGR